MILFRPVGLKELELIANAGFSSFPPRLPEQPIFYPVLNVGYARAIARDWNTVDERSGFVGFVTMFEVDDTYLVRFPVQVVGGRDAQELWVPAEELDEFNRHIVGKISVVESYIGPSFEGSVDPETHLPLT
jgi:hypothetical protein